MEICICSGSAHELYVPDLLSKCLHDKMPKAEETHTVLKQFKTLQTLFKYLTLKRKTEIMNHFQK